MSKQAKRALKVLFIGNSFTARNDAPGLVATIARAAGGELEHKLVSAGGASLRRHWNGDEARHAIESEQWDYVVLQEQSTLPIKNATRMAENVRLFDQLIRKSGAKTALYMIWARKDAPQTQKLITDTYLRIGKELKATVIPVGMAWQSFLKEHDEPVLHDRDGSHPSLAGSVLAALVMFSVLFEKDAAKVDVEIEGIPGRHLELFKQTAMKALSKNRNRPRDGT